MRGKMRQGRPHADLHDQQQGNRRNENLFHAPEFLTDEYRRQHEDERGQHYRQINFPVLGHRHAGVLHQPPGNTTNMAICVICSANTPKLRRISSPCRRTSPNGTRRALTIGTSGTTNSTTTIASNASTPVMAKMPPMPISRYKTGEATSETAKVRPIEAPTIAIAFVRCSSRVESAIKAVTAAEIAPAPWMARPMMTQVMSLAPAATKEPTANRIKPITMIRLRPY